MLKDDYLVPEEKTLENFYYINAKNSLKEYDLKCLISEGISKEQQEKGQREMAKLSLEPINRIKTFFTKRWLEGKNIKRNAIEKKRYNEVLNSLKSVEIDKDIGNYIKT